MSLPAFWIGVAALVGLDYAMRTWSGLHARTVFHTLGSVGVSFVLAWGCWLLVGRFGAITTSLERRRYVITLAMFILALSWFARRYAR